MISGKGGVGRGVDFLSYSAYFKTKTHHTLTLTGFTRENELSKKRRAHALQLTIKMMRKQRSKRANFPMILCRSVVFAVQIEQGDSAKDSFLEHFAFLSRLLRDGMLFSQLLTADREGEMGILKGEQQTSSATYSRVRHFNT